MMGNFHTLVTEHCGPRNDNLGIERIRTDVRRTKTLTLRPILHRNSSVVLHNDSDSSVLGLTSLELSSVQQCNGYSTSPYFIPILFHYTVLAPVGHDADTVCADVPALIILRKQPNQVFQQGLTCSSCTQGMSLLKTHQLSPAQG